MGRGRGTGDVGTRGRGDVGTRGLGDVGTWGREDSGTRGRVNSGMWGRIFTICLTFHHISQNLHHSVDRNCVVSRFKFLVCMM